ncbi:putative high affinity copper protein [Dichotomopilus funicola]|uniref:Copper transport protein n=1 Tax=Dichotomopilus funicola TaxID=1934379 RepID=A0AAN6ZIU7_9PEZI|nr:putative high affinity copper protein [Dichotomopilus funicola]
MDHGGHGGSPSGPACKISMLWNWYTLDACFLARSFHITSHAAFAGTCVGVVLLVIALEALRRLGREYDERIQRGFGERARALAELADGDDEQGGFRDEVGGDGDGSSSSSRTRAIARGEPRTVTFRATPVQQLVRAVIHTATFGVAYVVMLLAMYYNGYIIISILVGALLGKFLCDWLTVAVVVGGDGEGKVKGSGNGALEEPTVCCG